MSELIYRADELPYRTGDLAGITGVLRHSDDDFRVEEIPAYEPADEGDHVFAVIEKRGLTTAMAATRMAEALGIRDRDVGWAGMKDRHAITRQTLSFPPPCTPEAITALELPDITILEARRHRHKLRTGHLRGNRFVLVVREVGLAGEADRAGDNAGAGRVNAAVERVEAILARLRQPPGLPNYFGEQRFGRDGDNAEIGRALVTSSPMPGGIRRPRGRKLRLFISALQSQLFNRYVHQRLDDGLFDRVIDGDLLQKTTTGGSFASSEPEVDQARLEAGEVVPTGPMVGHKIKMPPAGSAAFERESALLAGAGLSLDDFARVGKLGVGARRPIAVSLLNAAVRAIGEDAIELSFELPAGSYATTLMREIVESPRPVRSHPSDHHPLADS